MPRHRGFQSEALSDVQQLGSVEVVEHRGAWVALRFEDDVADALVFADKASLLGDFHLSKTPRRSQSTGSMQDMKPSAGW